MTLACSDLPPLIRQQKTFRAGNVFAAVKNGLYTVYSYGEHFPLAVKTEQGWKVNEDRYSLSTSRQQQRLSLRSLPGSEVLSTGDLCVICEVGDANHQRKQSVVAVTRRLKS